MLPNDVVEHSADGYLGDTVLCIFYDDYGRFSDRSVLRFDIDDFKSKIRIHAAIK